MIDKVAPFTKFAAHYDNFMLKCVDYEQWVKYVGKIFKTFKVKPKTILDLACGTGIPTLLFAKKGFRMLGIDLSRAMLDELQKKIDSYDITTYQADIRDFTIPTPADAAICLYDSINYLLTGEDLKRCFQCVRTALKKTGLFVFDMNTSYGLSTFWGNRETIREAGNIHSVWQNSYDGKTEISTLRLICYDKNGNHAYEEIHQERGYPLPLLEALLHESGFPEVKFYHHATFSPPTEMTVRIMVVAR